jgi:hypothetical protein
MDAKHFDRLTRALSDAGSRRGLLGLLAALPVLGGLFARLGDDEADAKGRRKRRKKRHKHGKGRHKHKKHKKKKCKPKSHAKTCAGKCGQVKNNCKKTVDCGSCACDPPCEVCFTCQEGPNTLGTCIVDPAQQAQACGEPGQVCLPDGACRCSGESCGPCQICQENGTCSPVADGACCAGGVCLDGVCEAEATLEMCGGRCDADDLPATFQCTGGDPVPCPACDGGCVDYGCADGGSRLFTPDGESFYCVVSVAPTGSTCRACPTGIPNPPGPAIICPPNCQTEGTLCSACPAGEGCLLVVCLEICMGAS